jgi:hypothetical protein
VESAGKAAFCVGVFALSVNPGMNILQKYINRGMSSARLFLGVGHPHTVFCFSGVVMCTSGVMAFPRYRTFYGIVVTLQVEFESSFLELPELLAQNVKVFLEFLADNDIIQVHHAGFVTEAQQDGMH